MTWSDILRTPGPDDQIWKIVDSLLPETQKTGLTVVLQILASALMLAAAIKLAYFIISAIVSSAYGGEALGNRFHKIWGPLAVVFGLGMLVPAAQNGLSASHALLRNLAAMPSVNVGNAIAIGAAEYIIKDGHPIMPLSAFGRELAWSIAQAEVCSHVYHAAVHRLGYAQSTRIPEPPNSTGELVETRGASKVIWDYGPACGSISLSYPSTEEFGEFGATRNAAAKKLIDDVRKFKIHTGLADVSKRGAEILASSAQVDAQIYTGLLVSEITDQLNKIGDEYERSIAEAAAAEATRDQGEQRTKLVDGVKSYGMSVFFAYYRTLSQLSEKANAYASEKPNWIPPNPAAWGSYEKDLKLALTVLTNQRTLESRELKLSADDLAFAGEEQSSLFADLINTVTHPVIDFLTSYDGWRQDPVVDMINIGTRMMTSAKVGFAVGMAATGASNFWSSTAGKIVEYAMTPGWWLLGAMYAGGAMLAIVLPNIPMIYGIFGIGAFTLELIVASIAVLIWAFAHTRLDHGDSFIGQSVAPGYKILFGLLLRLPINVCAFIAAHIANVVVLNIFLFLWSFGFRGSQGGQALGLAAIFVSFGVSMYVQWKIVVMMFSLNTNLNDRVAQWWGHATQGWGESAEGNTVIGAVGGAVGASGSPAKPRGKGDNKSEASRSAGGGVKAPKVPIPSDVASAKS
jgi:conjugal transfer/type IV secretion protein DotA/TraY